MGLTVNLSSLTFREKIREKHGILFFCTALILLFHHNVSLQRSTISIAVVEMKESGIGVDALAWAQMHFTH